MKNSGKIWKQIASEAQALRDETLAKVGVNVEIPAQLSRNVTDIPDKVLSATGARITSLAPQEIVSLVSDGKISAQDVTRAFLERAVIAQNLVSHLHPPKSQSQTPTKSVRQTVSLNFSLNKPSLGLLSLIPAFHRFSLRLERFTVCR